MLTPAASRYAQVTEVKFIRGDEKLRPLAGMLEGGNFNFVFPDETTTRVIRRGTEYIHGDDVRLFEYQTTPGWDK